MNKGQISFDLILTIMIVLIFVTEVQIVSSEMQAINKEAAIRNQQKAMAMNIYSILSTAKALDGGDNVQVEYTTEKIFTAEGETVEQQCEINLSDKTITYTRDAEEFVTTIPNFDIGSLSHNSSPIKCGEKIIISE